MIQPSKKARERRANMTEEEKAAEKKAGREYLKRRLDANRDAKNVGELKNLVDIGCHASWDKDNFDIADEAKAIILEKMPAIMERYKKNGWEFKFNADREFEWLEAQKNMEDK